MLFHIPSHYKWYTKQLNNLLEDSMAKIFPTLDNINRLKVKPTQDEKALLDYLIESFPDDVEIYFRPFFNGDQPDIVLIHKDVGVTIIEIKNWDLENKS